MEAGVEVHRCSRGAWLGDGCQGLLTLGRPSFPPLQPVEGRAERRGKDLAVFSQHPPGHFSHHKPQSQATWLSWKQAGIEQMVSTSQIPIKQGGVAREGGVI